MPKVGFSPENKSTSAYDYPKLSLNQGERARIVCIEEDPYFEYVHSLQSLKVLDGKPVKGSEKQRDGSFKEIDQKDFIGRYICLGNVEVVAKKGSDPDGCPVCAAAEESDQFDKPQRRFALHVIKYSVKNGTTQVQEPFGAELVLWSFTENRFSTLTDIATEHGSLLKKDLLLGPCENKQYQKFEIAVGSTAEWLKDPERKAHVVSLYKNNRLEDVTPVIARKVGRDGLNEEIAKVQSKYRQAYGTPGGEAEDAADFGEGNDIDLGSFLNDDPKTEEPTLSADLNLDTDEAPSSLDEPKKMATTPIDEQPPAADEVPDLSASLDEPEEKKEPVSTPSAPAGATEDLEDLFKDL